MADTPVCTFCGHVLDRVDHRAIEHLVLDDGVFRPVSVADPLPGDEFGLGSETQLVCGYCTEPLPIEARKFFYERWYQVLYAQGKL